MTFTEDTAPCSSMHSFTTTSANSADSPLTLIEGTAPDTRDTADADTTGGAARVAGDVAVTGFAATRAGSAGGGSVARGCATGCAGGVGVGAGGGGAGSALAPEAGSESRVATRVRGEPRFFRSVRSPRSA